MALAPSDPAVLLMAADLHESLGDRKQCVAFVKKAMAVGLTKDQLLTDPQLQEAMKDPQMKALLK